MSCCCCSCLFIELKCERIYGISRKQNTRTKKKTTKIDYTTNAAYIDCLVVDEFCAYVCVCVSVSLSVYLSVCVFTETEEKNIPEDDIYLTYFL